MWLGLNVGLVGWLIDWWTLRRINRAPRCAAPAQPARQYAMRATFTRITKGTIRDDDQVVHACLTLWADLDGSSDPGKQAYRWKTTGHPTELFTLVNRGCEMHDIGYDERPLWALVGQVPDDWTRYPEGEQWPPRPIPHTQIPGRVAP